MLPVGYCRGDLEIYMRWNTDAVISNCDKRHTQNSIHLLPMTVYNIRANAAYNLVITVN